MARRKLTMDRVFEVVEKLNNDWLELNDELRIMSLKDPSLQDLYKRYSELKNKFANIITLAQDDSWRIMAEGNGIKLPEE
jgi:hypothetical protein